MRRTIALAFLPAVSALALLGSACGSDDKASDTTTTSTTGAPSSSSSSSTATTTGATTSTASGTQPCGTSQLQGELGPTDAGAGQVYAPLILRNTSSATCELTGFPGVSVLDGSGNQIGEPATREGSEGGAVVLPPGGVASATLHTNTGINGPCDPASAQMRVYPPNQTEALTFSVDYTVCGGFSVTTMVPGDTGGA